MHRRPGRRVTRRPNHLKLSRPVRCLGVVLAWSTLLAAFAPAAGAVPPTPSFGAHIDGYAAHQGQSTCDPTEKPGVAGFRDLLLSTYPSTHDVGITRPCDAGGRSEHKEGRAWDWGADVNDAADRAAVDEALGWLTATDQWGNAHALARRFGLMYVIWNDRMWKAYPSKGQPSGTWHDYHGPNPHTDHVHFSFSWAGARGETTWWHPETTNPPAPPQPAVP